jgi:hypothetical protein
LGVYYHFFISYQLNDTWEFGPYSSNSAFDSSVMDTALRVGLQHISFKFTMCRSHRISYSQRSPFAPLTIKNSRKSNRGSSCENCKIWNKSFPASKGVTIPHCFGLLHVTGNQISVLILIIPKPSARKRCGYSSQFTLTTTVLAFGF